ncbi:MAG: peptidoglycan D,D-transpeptidase FtsI family protein, partial [Flavobacteriales bacterium]
CCLLLFYHSEISGEKGFEMVQKISGGGTKPLPSPKDIESVDGADLVSYLDIRIQDLCHNSLLHQLKTYQAESGSVVLMETKTGAIKAMVNLKRGRDSLYRETQNFAVGAATEPGSTFKLFSYMVAMEDGYIDTNDLIETGKGVRKFYKQTMRDSRHGGFGDITIKEAFELSSNIAIAQVIEDNYGENPQRFIDRLARFGLHQPIGVDIPGEAHPKIKQTSDQTWSKVSLPWMAYGYEVTMAPIQLLTFYNAIANGGEMIKPRLVKEIQRAGRRIKTIPKEVLNPKICSDATLGKLKAMMEGVVEQGTAKNIYSEQFSSAGKTGTCQVDYWKTNQKRQYQSSFAGYFPKEDPKYSCIVVVQKPNTSIGFYGNVVAAPVFETIRNALFTENTQDFENQEDIEFSKLPQRLKGSANQFSALAELMDWESDIEDDNS